VTRLTRTSPVWFKPVISDSGPVDLDWRKPGNGGLAKVISEFLSGSQATLAERIQKASPISYVKKDASARLH